jgi:hypothetical protein
MKLRYFTIITLIIMIVGCTKQNIILQDFGPEKTVHYSDIKNIEKISDYAIFLEKGDKIPVKMSLDSELVDIADWKCDLVLKQKVYFRLKLPEDINAKNKLSMSKNEKRLFLRNTMIYLSADAKRWVPYTDIRAAEKTFGIKGGSISFGMGITKQDGINIFLNAKTNRK